MTGKKQHPPLPEILPVSNTADIAVTLKGVSKLYGSLNVLRSVDLSIRKGECVCIVGPSGSGKTTLIRCINALETIDAGRIEVNGHPLGFVEKRGKLLKLSEKKIAAQRVEVGMVFQRFNLFPHLTVLQNIVCAPLRVRGRVRAEAEEDAHVLLRRVGLASKALSFPRELSGGQQQRVAICRALAMRPAIMLFDEPTSALDPEMVGEVLDVIEEMRKERLTMMIVTHEMKFARRSASRLIMMESGEIVEDAPPEVFFETPSDERTKKFLSKML